MLARKPPFAAYGNLSDIFPQMAHHLRVQLWKSSKSTGRQMVYSDLSSSDLTQAI